MGANYFPLLTDLFLFNCELKYMLSLSKLNPTLVKSMNNVTRYIDDVAAFYLPNFSKYLHKIYPPVLEITESPSSNNVHY